MSRKRILIALDSVGIDPLGHNRPESVYSDSRFLFPRGVQGQVLSLPDAPLPGILVETDVTGGAEQGAIECAITYTSIFSGQSAIREHGHLEQLGSSRGHPKSKVPTWYFGPDAQRYVTQLSRPEGIFQVLTRPVKGQPDR